MTKRIIGVGLAALAITIPVSACGSDGSDEATAANEPTKTEEVAEVEVDRNQEIADQYVKIAPGAVAGICKGLPMLGEERVTKIGTDELGGQILRMGGQPSEVMALILDHC